MNTPKMYLVPSIRDTKVHGCDNHCPYRQINSQLKELSEEMIQGVNGCMKCSKDERMSIVF